MRKLSLLGALALILVVAGAVSAQQTSYGPEEYKDYQAALNEKVLAQRIKLMNAFVAKWPQSTMLAPYVYPLYLSTSQEALQARQPKVGLEAADRYVEYAKPEKLARFQALYLRTLNYHAAFDEKAADANDMASKENAVAKEGLELIPTLEKPEQLQQTVWDQQMTQAKVLLNFTVGATAQHLKNLDEAAEGFKKALELNPADAATSYRLGLVSLQRTPPQHMDGFWALARSIALKMQGEAQVRTYLRSQVLRYQNTQCDKELDRQVNELVTLAGQSPTRPVDYYIPSDADLTAARENIAQFLETLKTGGPQATRLWLAVCGLEFPDVAVKVIEVADNGASTTLKVFRAPTPEEMEKATEANMELLVVTDQPEAKRIKKDDFVRFTGTLASYQPEPFLLSWNQAKINPEDIPAEEAQPAKKGPAKKRPGRQ